MTDEGMKVGPETANTVALMATMLVVQGHSIEVAAQIALEIMEHVNDHYVRPEFRGALSER